MQTHANYKNAKQLFALRNLLIFGQIFSLLLVYFGLNIEILSLSVSFVITSQIIFNLFIWQRIQSKQKISDNEVFFHLLFDVLCLAIILYFSGGATNPFIILFLFPLTIAVTILPTRLAWALAVATIFCYSILMVQYKTLPINLNMHETNTEYGLHIIGMWIAFVGIATLVTFYVFGIRNTLKEQQKSLIIAQKKRLEDEQLITLGVAATNAAYEMKGTLNAMSFITNEIKNQLQSKSLTSNDLALLDLDTLNLKINKSQEAITDVSFIAKSVVQQNNSNSQQPAKATGDVAEYLQSILDQVYVQHPDAVIDAQWTQHSNECRIVMDKLLTQAILIILKQPIEAASSNIHWQAAWDDKLLNMEITSRTQGAIDSSTFTDPVTNTISSDRAASNTSSLRSGVEDNSQYYLKAGIQKNLHQELKIESKLENLQNQRYKKEMDLGMLLAQAIIHRIEGRLQCLNLGQGKTCIKISLPLLGLENT